MFLRWVNRSKKVPCTLFVQYIIITPHTSQYVVIITYVLSTIRFVYAVAHTEGRRVRGSKPPPKRLIKYPNNNCKRYLSTAHVKERHDICTYPK